MKPIDEDPRKKPEQNKENDTDNQSANGKKGVYSDIDAEKTRNYMEGDDDDNGPDLNKKSDQEDGDTSVNAGVFK